MKNKKESELSKGKDSIIQDYAGRILVLQDKTKALAKERDLLQYNLKGATESETFLRGQLQKLKEDVIDIIDSENSGLSHQQRLSEISETISHE